MRAADSSARLGAVLTHAERAPSRSVRRARQRTQRPVSLSLAMGKDKSKKDVGAAQVRPALARSALAAIEPAPRPRVSPADHGGLRDPAGEDHPDPRRVQMAAPPEELR